MASKFLTLVPNWKESWKWLSVQLHVIATMVMGALLMTPHMPDEIQALLPEWARPIAVAGWLVLGLYARLIQQGRPKCPSEE